MRSMPRPRPQGRRRGLYIMSWGRGQTLRGQGRGHVCINNIVNIVTLSVCILLSMSEVKKTSSQISNIKIQLTLMFYHAINCSFFYSETSLHLRKTSSVSILSDIRARLGFSISPLCENTHSTTLLATRFSIHFKVATTKQNTESEWCNDVYIGLRRGKGT